MVQKNTPLGFLEIVAAVVDSLSINALVRHGREAHAQKQGMKLTDALLAEHVVFHSIFSSIHKAMPEFKLTAEVRTAASVLLRTLEEHGKAEHDLLFPPIEPYLNDIGHLEHFHQEDEAIANNLQMAANADEMETGKSHLHKALRLASEHFDKEERLVFPLAEKHISEESLHALGEQWRRMKEL